MSCMVMIGYSADLLHVKTNIKMIWNWECKESPIYLVNVIAQSNIELPNCILTEVAYIVCILISKDMFFCGTNP